LRKRTGLWLFVLLPDVLLAQDQRRLVAPTPAATDPAIHGAQLPRVVILATGGTIASKHDPEKGGYTTALTGEQLAEAVPALKEVARVDVEQISNIPSSNMTSEIWLTLLSRAAEEANSLPRRGCKTRPGRDRTPVCRSGWSSDSRPVDAGNSRRAGGGGNRSRKR
jgi:hypothetical protein